jgi:putative cell wall-binding protein
LAKYAFTDSQVETTYIATGTNFPDALAAGSPAGHLGSPVVLVDGRQAGLDASTTEFLTEQGSQRYVIAGGPAAVSPGIEGDLSHLGTAVRLAGADRYETAVAINEEVYPDPYEAFVVTGENFPDALSATPWAGRIGAPVYLSQRTCVPAILLETLREGLTVKATLVGGTSALSPAVEQFTSCR